MRAPTRRSAPGSSQELCRHSPHWSGSRPGDLEVRDPLGPLLDDVEVVGPCPGRQVLPPSVGGDHHDGARLDPRCRLGRPGQGRTRRDAGEDPHFDQPAGPLDRFAWTDDALAVQKVDPVVVREDGRDVSVIEMAEAVDQLAGLRNLDDGYVPPIFTDNNGVDLLDGKRIVRPRESIEWTRRLIEVGIFAGISSGAALAGAAKTAARIESGTIVVIAADGGWKYLSTGAWTDDLDIVEERARRITYF